MRIDRAIIEIIFISDDIFHEGVTFDNSFRILEEVFEDRKLCFRKFHFFSAKERDVIFTVDFYRSERKSLPIFFLFFFRTFCDGSDTSYELTWGKWLCHIVISAEFKELYFIIF